MAGSDPLALLGLARRAGGVLKGTDAARRALRSGEARLVLLAGDASPAQLEKVLGLLRHGAVPYAKVADRVTLGAAVGDGPLSVVAVVNGSFAKQLQRRLPVIMPGGGGRSQEGR